MIFTHKTKLDCKTIESRIEEDSEKINLMIKHHFHFHKIFLKMDLI